jgi:hypothetical protein
MSTPAIHVARHQLIEQIKQGGSKCQSIAPRRSRLRVLNVALSPQKCHATDVFRHTPSLFVVFRYDLHQWFIPISCPCVPSAISRARLGIKPFATQDLARSQVAASKPTIMPFGAFTIVPGWLHVGLPKKKAVPLPSGRLPFSGLTRHDKQSPPPGRFYSS